MTLESHYGVDISSSTRNLSTFSSKGEIDIKSIQITKNIVIYFETILSIQLTLKCTHAF